MATQSNSPLARVKKDFGDKKKLIEALQALAGEDLWLGRTSKDRGQGKGLNVVSNAKLLKLYATFKAAKEKFGSRSKLIDAIVEVEKRTKDEGFRKRIDAYPVPRLFDLWKSAQKRTSAKAAAKPTAAARSQKPAAPKTAAKKTPKKS